MMYVTAAIAGTVPPAPTDVGPPEGWHSLVLWGSAVALAIAAGFGVRELVKDRSPALLAMLVGGGLCIILEPFWDVLGLVYFHHEGVPTTVTVIGRTMPMWTFLAYHIYAGLTCYVFYRLFRSQPTLSEFRRTVLMMFALNLAIEVPIVATGVYEYYGPQPFNLTGFPLWWLFANAGGMLSGAILATLERRHGRWSTLSAVVIVPSAFGTWEIFAGWPTFAALSAGTSHLVTYPAAIATIAISVTLMLAVRATVSALSDDVALRADRAAPVH